MNNFIYIALLIFLGIVAVQGYGPKVYRKYHESSRKSSHGSKQRPSHESSHHGSPQRGSSHHGPAQRGSSNHGPSQKWSAHQDSFHRKPNDRRPNDFASFPNQALRQRPMPVAQDIGRLRQVGHWDNSPVWLDDQDSLEISRERSGSYDSYGSDYDNRGPDSDNYGSGGDSSYGRDSSGPDESDYTPGSGSSEDFGPSGEDGSYYDHFHSKVPGKRPHTQPPRRTTTTKPTRRPRPPRPPPRPAPQPETTTTEAATQKPTPRPSRATPRPSIATPRPSRGTGSTGTVWHPNTPTEETTHWETTTALLDTTTEGEEEITTISPEITNCIASCASTPEYNPVCGSNGETYGNEGKLFCAKSCGVSVTLRRRSECPPPPFDEDDNNNQPPPTPPTTTINPSFGRTTAISSFQRCMRHCRITASFTPVCGSDLVTYMNIDRLKCAQSCGEVVEVLCEKPCAACGYNPVTPKTTTLPPTTTSSSNIGRTTLEPDIKECVDACPTTEEFNPVCGSNSVTYKNPGHLICAQICGVAVTVRRFGPCAPTTASTTTTTTITTTTEGTVTYPPAVLICIRRCPVTSEYNPVCGTDDLTYVNLGNLECAKHCGVDVKLKYSTRCIDEFDLGTDGTTTTSSQTIPNINGNKDVVTTTVKSTSLFTSPTTVRSTTTNAAPITTTLSTASSTTTTLAPISSSTLGFSIPQDVLDTIFKSTTAGLPLTTTTLNPDADEDLDLDARFGQPTTAADTT